MKNTIKYYYDFKEAKIIFDSENKKYIKNGDEVYEIFEVIDRESVMEAYNITQKYDEYQKIIMNKYNSIFTPYKEKIFVLIEKKQIEKGIRKINISKYEFKKLKIDNWNYIWQRKIDYFEFQMLHIKGKYKIVDESFDYFIGLAENAISYLWINRLDNTNENTICRRRIDKDNNYNPLNMVIDCPMRDVGEYLKLLFWTKSYDEAKLRKIIKTIIMQNENVKILFARLLYPSHYFDIYEKIIQKEQKEKELINIINRIDEYEEYISKIYEIIKEDYKDINPIEWIKKSELL